MHPAVLNPPIDQHTAKARCDTGEQRYQPPAQQGRRVAATVVAAQPTNPRTAISDPPGDWGSHANGLAIEVTAIHATPDGPADDTVTGATKATVGRQLFRSLWPRLDPLALIERGLRWQYTQAKPNPLPTLDNTSRNPGTLQKITTFTLRRRATTILVAILLLLILATAARARLPQHDDPRTPTPPNQSPSEGGTRGGGIPPRFQ
jgi:hypothetical protein